MNTEVLKLDELSAKKAANIIRSGGIVAFPTETVYGLGADVFNENAVRKIFEAKGRPSDNPLIVHIADKEQIFDVAEAVNKKAEMLIDRFMPGPITVVLPKRKEIPLCVTGGIDTVGVRLPEHPGARLFIKACGCPIPAPSANSSGKPSPTCATHVYNDLNGKIPLILDGGSCSGGVESTVISLCTPVPLLLRPGLVTLEMLKDAIGKVDVHPAVLNNNNVDKAASPGMKYKHYSPKARVIIVDGDIGDAERLYRCAEMLGKNPLLLWNKEDLSLLHGVNAHSLLENGDARFAANRLFDLLRLADDEGCDIVFITAVDKRGAGLSVMNRMLRSAAFTVIKHGDVADCDSVMLKTVLQNLL